MNNTALPTYIAARYDELKDKIQERLSEFSSVPQSEYFYELCFCLCTPQSKAENANKVIEILKKKDFLHRPFNPAGILRQPEHYIRFHNTKAARLLQAREYYDMVINILERDISPIEKRSWLVDNIKGMGMKEASHFLRNIGYRGLAILDRHILKHLVHCNLYKEVPKVTSAKQYLEVEAIFLNFAASVSIPIDELDLLFWSYETGIILK